MLEEVKKEVETKTGEIVTNVIPLGMNLFLVETEKNGAYHVKIELN